MLSPPDDVDGHSIDTASYSAAQNPSDGKDTSPNKLVLTTSSYASPFLFSPALFDQSSEHLTMENIFRRLNMSLSENGTFPCSARVNEAIRDMMETTNTDIPAIPPPNGVFTLFGSPIVLKPPPGFNFHSGEFQFHGNSDLLHRVTNANLQHKAGLAVPNIVPPLNEGPGAGPSSSSFPQSLASCPRFTESLTSSCPALAIEPLAPGPTFPEPLPPGFRLPDALPADFPLPDPKGKGKMHLINEAAQRRRIRMSKNRASAARSRARRRAYTAELEREIQYLTEENDRIRREAAEVRFEATEQESTRKRWFGRAASPPY